MQITVVGSGFVGQTTAMRALEKGLGDVVLIDIIEGKPQGLALDLKEAAPVEGYDPVILGTKTTPTPLAATSWSSRPGSRVSRV